MSEYGVLPGSLAKAAREAALEIAGRLADQELVSEAIRRSTAASTFPFLWGGPSLFGGYVGSALVFRYAALAEPQAAGRWQDRMRQALRKASEDTVRHAVRSPSIGGGTAGLAFALDVLADDEPGYSRVLRKVQDNLAAQVAVMTGRRPRDGVGPGQYDVINGAAGVLGYLAATIDPPDSAVQACKALVDDLTWLCSSDETSSHTCHVPAAYATDLFVADHPLGYVDLGLAHGIAGPLAAISQAVVNGYGNDQALAAIRYTADFLLAASDVDDQGLNWPHLLPLDSERRVVPTASSPNPMSWCYGPPGICSALLDAARALDDDALRQSALSAFEAALRRAIAEHNNGRLLTASLCHGWAGLLTLSVRFAEASGSDLGGVIPLATERLLEFCDDREPLAFREPLPSGGHLDDPSLLDGAGGVALALWSVSAPVDSRWKQALLIG